MKKLNNLFNCEAVAQGRTIKRLAIFFFAASLYSFPVQAFNHLNHPGYDVRSIRNIIKGKLTNERGEALAGCTITEKGTKNSTQSGADGSFSIDVQGPSSIIVITYVGYESQEVKVGNLNNYNISASFYRFYFMRNVEFHSLFFQHFGQFFRQSAIHSRNNSVHEFHNRNLRSQS